MNYHQQGLTEFFHRSAEVYRHQDRTGRLALTPVFQVIDELEREADLKTRFKRHLATGRYAHRHLWQAFFFADLIFRKLSDSSRSPFLGFHDRVFRPLTDFLPFHVLAGGILRLGCLGCRLYFRWREG
jgi:hypothetical protein